MGIRQCVPCASSEFTPLTMFTVQGTCAPAAIEGCTPEWDRVYIHKGKTGSPDYFMSAILFVTYSGHLFGNKGQLEKNRQSKFFVAGTVRRILAPHLHARRRCRDLELAVKDKC